jgi:hypothetical protein
VSFETALLNGLAEYLAAAGVGTFRASGSYQSGDSNPIFIGVVPASPDRAVTLTGYPVEDSLNLSDSTQGVQVRTRGTKDPRTTSDLADAVFDALHGLEWIELGGIRVSQARRVSGSPLGPDENGRHERSDNYYLLAHRPSQNRS